MIHIQIRLLPLLIVFFLVPGLVQASSSLIFPRLSFGPEDLTGIAIVNPTEEIATVTFTAYGVDGAVLTSASSTTGMTDLSPYWNSHLRRSPFCGSAYRQRGETGTILWLPNIRKTYPESLLSISESRSHKCSDWTLAHQPDFRNFRTWNGNKKIQEIFQNPISVDIASGEQFSEVTLGIFGVGTDPTAIGWIEATSPTDGLTGFFQVLDYEISFLDGADLPQVSSRLIFQDVRLDSGFSTTTFLINPNESVTTTVQLSLINGASTKIKSIEIVPKGIVELNVEDFFKDVDSVAVSGVNSSAPLFENSASEAYLIAEAGVDIAGFELVGKEGEDLLGLNARPASELLSTLLFPQLAVLDPFITEAVIGNFSDEASIVTMTVYQENGQIFNDEVQTNPVTLALNPGQSLRIDLKETFGFSGTTTIEGWLKVESTSPSINGSVSYSIPELGSIAAVSSVMEGSRKALISHIGTSLGFFTGLATLNAGALAANVRVVALMPNGTVLGTFTTTLQPGERRSDLLSDIIPEAEGQAGGMIWIESDVPVYLTAIFGSLETGVFANVPPQSVPESFQPDVGIEQLEVNPSLVVLVPGQSQQFELDIVAELGGETIWGANGITGGNQEAGTINGTGLYTAPALIPSSQPVTVTATKENQTVGASVDIQTKTVVFGGLGIVQSVAYLTGLERLYTSELSFSTNPSTTTWPQASEQSTIFDVTTGTQEMIALFNDDIPNMIAYQGVDNEEYLLLAGKTSGTIQRLNPITQTSLELITGLNAPNALVIDTNGDLLVAEADRVSTISTDVINQGLTLTQLEIPSVVQELSTEISPTGIAVDQCTGNVYISQASTGEVLVINRHTGKLNVVASGLSSPTKLLDLYRAGVSCPDSLHLLVIESGDDILTQGRITLIVPAKGIVSLWAETNNARDLILLPAETPFGLPKVLIAEVSAEGELNEVQVKGRYEPPPNLPKLNGCLAIVNIQDPNLEAAIRDSLPAQESQKESTNFITCQEAIALEVLFASDYGIESLEGLQGFTNLKEMYLFANSISDINPLAKLDQLTLLDLGNNQVSNLDALVGLTQMQHLYLDNNLLNDTPSTPPFFQFPPVLSPLSNMPNLEWVFLGWNGIIDLSPLSESSQLKGVCAQYNQITDISNALDWPHLVALEIGGNPILDLNPLAALTGLLILSAQELSLTSIDFLEPLNSLEWLRLDGNSIGEISVVSNFNNLLGLNLTGNTPSDFTPIGSLSNLNTLYLTNTQLGGGDNVTSNLDENEDLNFLSGSTGLQHLKLNSNFIQNISPISALVNLTTLFLDDNLIEDIMPLVENNGLGSGDYITLQNNQLSTEDCTNVQTLLDREVVIEEDIPCQ